MRSGFVLDHVAPVACMWVPEGMALLCYSEPDTPKGELVKAVLIKLPQDREFTELAKALFNLGALKFDGEDYELELDETCLELLSSRMKELVTLMTGHAETNQAFGEYLLTMSGAQN